MTHTNESPFIIFNKSDLEHWLNLHMPFPVQLNDQGIVNDDDELFLTSVSTKEQFLYLKDYFTSAFKVMLE